ncbi:MAG: DUF167 domain-containing protein [Siphonobacter aquaeclarae]|jgi:uncharacterized protein (TIGR00251 family)|nr:DUF167 domain-containing protein [Siphonobacter aquaeclarae]
MTLHVRVKPNSKVDGLAYDDAGNLTVKIKAPAQDGKANDYLVKYLAGVFGISKSKVQLVSGFTNPHKKLEIDAEEAEIKQILQQLV